MIEIPNRQEIVALAKLLATPIDFEELEKTGIIERHGVWFKVKNLKTLPEHAAKTGQINQD